MNRREFNRGLGMLASASILPKTILAAPAEPLHLTTPPYNWAAFVARVHNAASPKMFKRHFQLSDDMANQVFETLVNEGVVAAPNAAGLANVVSPFRRFPSKVDAMAHLSRLATKPKVVLAEPKANFDTGEGLNRFLDADSSHVNQPNAELQDDTPEDSPAPPAKDDQGSDQLA